MAMEIATRPSQKLPKPRTRSRPGLQGADYTEILKKVVSGQRTSVIDSAPYFVDAFKKFKRQCIDIEVENESEDASAENPGNPITLISIKDNFTPDKAWFFTFREDFDRHKSSFIYYEEHTKRTFDLVVFWYQDESTMLADFFYFIKKTRPDMIYGWYFEDFDIPYIINRAKLLDLDAMYLMSPDGTVYSQKNVQKANGEKDFNRHGFRNVISGVTIFDMKWGYERIQGKFPEGNGLNQVALRHLGYGKKSTSIIEEPWYRDPVPMKENDQGEKVEDFKEEGFFKFIIYGFYDVLEPELVEDKTYTMFTFFFITRFTSIEWEKLHHFSVAIDMAQLMYKDPSLFLPTKRIGVEVEEYDLEGGHVENPPVGMIEWYLIVLDASRLYPNAMRDANLGADTYIDPKDHEAWADKDVVKLGNGDWFRKDIVSFLSDTISKIFALRDFVDKQIKGYDPADPMFDIWQKIKTVVKNLINAIYGSNGNPYTRMFHLPTARSTTYLGRELLDHDKKYTIVIAKRLKKSIKYDQKWADEEEFLEDGTILVKNDKVLENGVVLKSNLTAKYLDTDSIMTRPTITDLKQIVAIGHYYNYFMNKSISIFCKERNMFGKYLKIEFEKVCLNMFFPVKEGEGRGTKKQYCYYEVWHGKFIDPPKFVIMGMAGKKSNTPIFAKNMQVDFLKNACKGMQQPQLEEYVVNIIKQCKGYLHKTNCYKCGSSNVGKNDDVEAKKPLKCKKCGTRLSRDDLTYDPKMLMQIGTPYRFGKPADQYKSTQLASKIAASIKAHFNKQARKGETYLYFWLAGNKKTTNVFAMNPESPKVPRGIEINVKLTIDKLVHDKLKTILPLFEIEWKDVRNSDTSTSLSKFIMKGGAA